MSFAAITLPIFSQLLEPQGIAPERDYEQSGQLVCDHLPAIEQRAKIRFILGQPVRFRMAPDDEVRRLARHWRAELSPKIENDDEELLATGFEDGRRTARSRLGSAHHSTRQSSVRPRARPELERYPFRARRGQPERALPGRRHHDRDRASAGAKSIPRSPPGSSSWRGSISARSACPRTAASTISLAANNSICGSRRFPAYTANPLCCASSTAATWRWICSNSACRKGCSATINRWSVNLTAWC